MPPKKKVTDNQAFDMMSSASDATNVDYEYQLNPNPEKKKVLSSETLHNALMGAGFVPAIGAPADVVDSFMYLLEGDAEGAMFAGISAVPLGSVTKIFRGIAKGRKKYRMIETAGKIDPRSTEIIDDFASAAEEGFHKSSRLGGGHVGYGAGYFGRHAREAETVFDIKKSRYLETSNSAPYAAGKYGPGMLRIELDRGVLGHLKNSGKLQRVGQDVLNLAGGRYNVEHLIFPKGLKLKNIKDISFFTDFKEYADMLLRDNKVNIFQYNKMMDEYRFSRGG